MKRGNIIIFYALLILLSLMACKQEQGFDALEDKSGKEISLSLEGEILPFTVVDEDGKILDERLRTAVPIELTGSRDSNPTIAFKPKGTLNWIVCGYKDPSKYEVGTTEYRASVKNGKQHIKASFSTKKKFLNQGILLYSFLTGSLGANAKPTDWQWICEGEADPNGAYIEELPDGKTLDRHIPIQSQDDYWIYDKIYPSSNPNGSKSYKKKNIKFKPQGCLLGIRLKNETGKQIHIKSLNINYNGDSYYSGKFSNRTDSYLESKNDEGDRQLFKKFPLRSYQSTKEPSLAVGQMTNGRFYIWSSYLEHRRTEAYHRPPFCLNVTYTEEGSNEILHSHSQFIDRTQDFEGGYAYRLTLRIRPSAVWRNHPNLLELVAEYNVNQSMDGFATNHNIPGDSGYLTYAEAKALEGKAEFSKYKLPTIKDYKDIFPEFAYFCDFEHLPHLQEGASGQESHNGSYIEHAVAWSFGEVYGLQTGEIHKHKFVAKPKTRYAARYQRETNAASAWRWEISDKGIMVTVLSTRTNANSLNNTDLSASIRMNPDLYFDDKHAVKRFFPAHEIQGMLNDQHQIHYWTYNASDDKAKLWTTSKRLTPYYSETFEIKDLDKNSRMPVRLFLKQLP